MWLKFAEMHKAHGSLLEVRRSTRTRGYGYDVHAVDGCTTGIPGFTRKEHDFVAVWDFDFFLFKILLTMKQFQCDMWNRMILVT